MFSCCAKCPCTSFSSDLQWHKSRSLVAHVTLTAHHNGQVWVPTSDKVLPCMTQGPLLRKIGATYDTGSTQAPNVLHRLPIRHRVLTYNTGSPYMINTGSQHMTPSPGVWHILWRILTLGALLIILCNASPIFLHMTGGKTFHKSIPMFNAALLDCISF